MCWENKVRKQLLVLFPATVFSSNKHLHFFLISNLTFVQPLSLLKILDILPLRASKLLKSCLTFFVPNNHRWLPDFGGQNRQLLGPQRDFCFYIYISLTKNHKDNVITVLNCHMIHDFVAKSADFSGAPWILDFDLMLSNRKSNMFNLINWSKFFLESLVIIILREYREAPIAVFHGWFRKTINFCARVRETVLERVTWNVLVPGSWFLFFFYNKVSRPKWPLTW